MNDNLSNVILGDVLDALQKDNDKASIISLFEAQFVIFARD